MLNQIIKRGQIYNADLGKQGGSIQGGVRPVVIILNNLNNKFSPTVNVLPITSRTKNSIPVHVEIGITEGLPQLSTNDIEIGNMLKIMKRSSVISVRKTLSILNSYVKWCIINGKRGKFENGLNYMDIFIRTEKDLNQYVSNKQLYNKILTREELEDLLYVPVNASDRAIILSMYEFIGGRELYELRSLTINNINKDTNTVKLTDMDGNIREQSISSRLIKILEDVDENEKTYIYNNGEEDSAGRVIETNLAISNYIIKPSKRLQMIIA